MAVPKAGTTVSSMAAHWAVLKAEKMALTMVAMMVDTMVDLLAPL